MPKIKILIVEDESPIALGLAMAAEDSGFEVVGPVATVADALALLKISEIDGAVIDVNLIDGHVAPVAIRLWELALPFVVHSAIGLPAELLTIVGDAPSVMKPSRPERVVEKLLEFLKSR